MNTSFSCSDVRTPTKASASITDFSLASLCSSVKKPQATTTTTTSSSFAFDFKTDRDLAKASNTGGGGGTSLYAAMTGYTGSSTGGSSNMSNNASNNTSSTTTTSSSSYLSCNMDMIQSKIEYLERERVDLAMQLHKRDEKDRDRKLRLETLETRLKHAEEDKSKAYQEAHEQREQVIRLTCEVNDLKTEIIRLNKEIQSTNRFEAMDVWKKMTVASRELKRCEEELTISQNERAVLTSENNRLLNEQEQLMQRFQQLEKEKISYQENMHKLQHTLQQHWIEIPQLKEENTMLREQLQSLQTEYQQKIEEWTSDNQILSQRVQELQEELTQQMTTSQTNTMAIVKEKEHDLEIIIQDLKKKLMENEQKRRKLHNQVQDLRGNIRVFVRCRPFLSSDGLDLSIHQEVIPSTNSHLLFHDDECSLSVLNQHGNTNVSSTKPHQFTFDHIFKSNTNQEDIYKEVSDLVQSVMDGYRVCVFSYGQTGSGKTHTMTGSKYGAERGIIPRAIEELLEQSQAMKELGWQITINASIVELYNEDLRDLLVTSNTSIGSQTTNHGKTSASNAAAAAAAAAANAANGKGEKFKIMKHEGRVMVSGLTHITVPTEDYEEGVQRFHKLLDISSQARTTAATGMNEMSSRSHLIVMIDVTGTFTLPATSSNVPSQTKTLHGGLRLCDLAGSERLDRTNTLHDATRLKETVNINKSLSCLADVFLALSHKSSHVPYRNSKLTMLLQDCLSGDGKSLMFVNVSPTMASTQETLCSLRFANQVSQVELGKAQKHMITTVIQPAVLPVPPPPATSSVIQTTTALMPPPPPVAASGLSPTPKTEVSSSSATPRPDRVKMRSSSFSAKLMQQPNYDAAIAAGSSSSKSNETTPTRAKLSVKQATTAVATTVGTISSAISNVIHTSVSTTTQQQGSEPKHSDKKAVRFSTLVTSASANATTDAEPAAPNTGASSARPLPLYSFLSGNQPERAIGTAPKVRNLGASRRNSTVAGPSLASAVSAAQRIKTTEASYLIHHPAAAAALLHHKENETNNASAAALPPSTVATSTRGHKRESVCPELMGAKRLRSVTTDTAGANAASFGPPEPWNSSTLAAGAGKKSTWR